MKQLFIKLFIFSILFAVITKYVLDPRFKKASNFEKSLGEFYLQPKDSVDIMILGSSHARNTFNPHIIDNILNVNSFNLGSGGQRIIVTNSLLEDLLKEFTPKLVILDVFPGSLSFPEKQHQKSNQLQVTDNVKWSFNKVKLINTIFSYDEFPAVYSQTIRNHKNWNKIKWKSNFIKENNNALIYKGFSGSYFKINDKERRKLSDYREKMDAFLKADSTKTRKSVFSNELEEVIRTFEICKKNNVKLMLTSAPYFNAFYNPQGDNFHFLTKKLSDSLGIHFLDLNTKFKDLGLEMNDFRDRVHVNIAGADKATKYLVKTLVDLDYFTQSDPKEDIDAKMNLLGNEFTKILNPKIEKEILPNIFVEDIVISRNREFYEVELNLSMNEEDIGLIKEYNIEYFATVYEKDRKRLKGKFKNTKREVYTFYNSKISSIDGKNQIIFRVPITEIKEFENIRIYSFKKGKKMTTQDYEINLERVNFGYRNSI